MKKRIVSLVLVVAMLLCVLPAASATENENPTPSLYSYYLSLSESIAIKFRVTNWVEGYYVTFNDERVDNPKLSGTDAIFTVPGLSPALLAKEVTAQLYNSEGSPVGDSRKVSIKSYCEAILAGESYSAHMKNLAADLLNYGKAFRDYKVDVQNKPAADYPDFEISSAVDNYTTLADPNLESVAHGATTPWAGATIVLDDVVKIRFDYNGLGTEGLTLYVNGEPVDATFVACPNDYAENSVYYSDLNPTQMREEVVARLYKDGEPVTGEYHCSIESYAANAGTNEENLCKLMMKYGDAVAAYVEASASDVLYYNNFNYTDSLSGLTSTQPFVIDPSNGQLKIERTKAAGVVQIPFPNSSAKISVEWDLRVTQTGSGGFRCGPTFMYGSSILYLPIAAEKFKIVDSTTAGREWTSPVSWSGDKTYHMKVEFDLSTDKYTYYIDETRIANNEPTRRDASACTNMAIDFNTVNGTVTVYVDNLVVKQIS